MKVSVPGALTCFFYPLPHHDPRRAGSIGLGIAIEDVVRVRARPLRTDRVRVRANHPVGDEIARACAETLGTGLSVRYEFRAPPGCGLGTSAASALGTLLAAQLRLEGTADPRWIARRAHEIELQLGTGLGDVTTIWHGGAVLRLRTGYPDRVKTARIPLPERTLTVERPVPLDTRRELPRLDRSRLEPALAYTQLLTRRPDPDLALRLARRFARRLGLNPPRNGSIALLSRTRFRPGDEGTGRRFRVSLRPFPKLISLIS